MRPSQLPEQKEQFLLPHSGVVATLFLFSGATGLVYQVVWFRMLSLVFGNTVLASSTVLSVFFAGLALGSYWFGKIADRSNRRILLYGILEGGIGIYAIFFPILLSALDGTYLFLYRKLGESLSLNLIRAGISALMLLPPTVLMGGTFPLLVRHFVARLSDFSHRISLLYFINTTGAVIGSVLAGFFLIAAFGIRTTTFLTAAVNILICAVCVGIQKRDPAMNPISDPLKEKEQDYRHGNSFPAFVLLATTVSGFSSILYEVVWTRAFSSYFGSSVYSFATVLAAFLVGIALGSLYYYRTYGWSENPLRHFGQLQLRVALSVVLFLVFFMKLPVFILWGIQQTEGSFIGYQFVQFVIILSAMLYTTVNLGAAFPAANIAYVDSTRSMGKQIGKVYAWNTIGSILGAFVTGFLLIPAIGMEKSIWLAFFLNLFTGLSALRISKGLDRMAIVWAAVCLIVFFLVPRWDRNVLNSGIYASAHLLVGHSDSSESYALPEAPGKKILIEAGLNPVDPPIPVAAFAGGDPRILFFQEGLTSTISVIEDRDGFKKLLINGKADASNNPLGDMRTQLLLGHLPLLLSSAMPRSALVIGLGSGTTVGSLTRYPLKQIDCVEIEPAVVEAAKRYFSDTNQQALNNPRVRLIVADGRNFLAATDKSYDIITSEPSNLWMAGCSNLFTREFFELAAARLNNNGMMCQWIHLYQISVDDIRTFLRTFQSVFPHVSIWVDNPDMLVVGSKYPIRINPAVLARRLAVPEIAADLQPSQLSRLEEFLPLYTADSQMARLFSHNAPINSDDHPILEFSAPKSLLRIQSNRIIRELITGVPYEKK